MPHVSVTVHENGLHPTEAAKAWHLHTHEGISLDDICDEVVNLKGERPGEKAVWAAREQFL